MNSNGCKINSHGLVEIIIFHDTGKIITPVSWKIIIITTICQVRSGQVQVQVVGFIQDPK